MPSPLKKLYFRTIIDLKPLNRLKLVRCRLVSFPAIIAKALIYMTIIVYNLNGRNIAFLYVKCEMII